MEKVFELNPHDRSAENKMVNGKQCTLVWYVDNKKVLHMEAKLVEYLISEFKNHFGEILVTRGKKHTFLGMNKNIKEDKKV